MDFGLTMIKINNNWKKQFSRKILERGENYYLLGAVEEIKLNEDTNTVIAAVCGSEMYNIEIKLSDDRTSVEEMYCDCQYAEDGENCKHMAAVLFELEEIDFDDCQNDCAPLDIDECISKLSVEELRELLSEAAKKDPALFDKIAIKTVPEAVSGRAQFRNSDIRAITRSATGRDGYIDYEDAYEYTSELCDYLEDRVPLFLERNRFEDALTLVCAVYDEATGTCMDDSDGGLSELADVCRGYWERTFKSGGIELKRKAFDWFRSKDKYDLLAYDYKYSIFTEPEFQSILLSDIDKEIESETEKRGYYPDTLIARRVDIMKNGGCTDSEINDYIKGFRYLPYS